MWCAMNGARDSEAYNDVTNAFDRKFGYSMQISKCAIEASASQLKASSERVEMPQLLRHRPVDECGWLRRTNDLL
jgi:hypothetical protein